MDKIEMTPIEALAVCQQVLLSIDVPLAYYEKIGKPIQNVIKLLEKVKGIFEPVEEIKNEGN